MANIKKYALTSLMTFALSVGLLIYGILTLGLFSNDKIIVSTLATTGPDYNVSFGQYKLIRLVPDSVKYSDVTGIMVTEESSDIIGNLLIDTDDFDHYYLIQFKMAGVKKSDSDYYHPLIKIMYCRQIDFLLFWALIIIEFGLLLVSSLFYSKYKRHLSRS